MNHISKYLGLAGPELRKLSEKQEAELFSFLSFPFLDHGCFVDQNGFNPSMRKAAEIWVSGAEKPNEEILILMYKQLELFKQKLGQNEDGKS